MASQSRRPKKIDVDTHKAPTFGAGCGGRRELEAGAEPTSFDGQAKQKSNLPAWVNERYANASKSIPREGAERLDCSEEFMTVPEAASVLRISERTLRRHLAEGGIRHIHAGKQIRIPREALLRGWKND